MVSIAKYDLSVDVLAELPLVDSLYRAGRTHRHEYRGFDRAVSRFDYTRPGF